MKKQSWAITLFFTMLLLNINAQKGTIRGTISDGITAELLPGVTVLVENGNGKGTSTDLDGNFNLMIEPGMYTLKISFVSYKNLIVDSVIVKADEVTLLGTLFLNEEVLTLDGAQVTAEAIKNNEEAMSTIKKKSPNLIDGISSESFKKIGDSDGASAMKRVTGVSVTGGKYVFVRGLGDRYTKTTLNGLDLPGLDPDRNSLQMDIFPTNIIDNIIVHKSFVAELPADFTGGIVDIVTKEFPDTKKSNITLGLGYNPDFHFNKDYLTYEGGKTDFLGFDDGTREIPAISNIPFYTDALSSASKADRYKEILKSFNPTLAAMKKTSMMDMNIGYGIGNQINKEKYSLGYNFVLNYKNETEFYQNVQYGRYGLSGDDTETEMEARVIQTGDYGVNNVMLSAMGGLAYKTNKSKIKLNVLHLQNGESKAGIFNYVNTDQGSQFDAFQHNLEYSQKSITNGLLYGKHSLDSNTLTLEWKLSPTFSQIYDPDIRFTRYRDDTGQPTIGTEAGFPQRIWRDLNEINIASGVDLTKDYQFKKRDAKFKFGGAYTYKYRDYVIRSFNLNIRNIPLTGDPNELFLPENLWPYNGNISSGTTYESTFTPNNPNQYDANVNYIAGYVSTEINPLKLLKAIVGVRMEKYTQRYTGQDQLGYNVLDNDVVLDDLGFYPSVNLVYALNEKNNLRASFTQTVARPSFKELSYAEIADPITGRTFIGGLFRDANDIEGIEYWDGKLTSTKIFNYDLRYEVYPGIGKSFSVGAFYKKFIDPIEIVQYATQAGAFQPRNVGDAQVLGGEIEWRQTLDSLSKKLENFSLVFNFTYTDSKIKLSKTEYDSRVVNAREGQVIGQYRDMAGQAPYMINAGIAYKGNAEKGFMKGLDAGIYYNVQGKTLLYTGIVDRPDIYSVPFHSLNFNMNKTFGKDDKMQFGLKIDNILNDKTESVYNSFNSMDQFFTSIAPGRRFQVRYTYNF